MKKAGLFISLIFLVMQATAQVETRAYSEQYRPQIHFSPKKGWMNDPNGMVYNGGVYHLFFQYYPDSTVWGPMHWGHATSKDLVHWKEQPVALYPDSIGYIFSGSAVLDKNNTSGFGKKGAAPLVAIFTQHDAVGERSGSDTFQTQSIAYSLDNGVTWTKYKNNPVLKNPGIKDFRDPKVMWYEEGKKWVMILAVKDHTEIYTSPDLKNWTKQSEFGKNIGAHGGVWECPDLFCLNDGNKKVWVMVVNINPGGPNGGSATQYFTGDFDGKIFSTNDTATKWLDYGPDEYAGITWSNTGKRKIFFGWMSNWEYAQLVPTEKWRSANTIPRDLSLKKIDGIYYLAETPATEISNIISEKKMLANIKQDSSIAIQSPCVLKFTVQQAKDFELVFSNSKDEQLRVGFDENKNQFFINREHAGAHDFNANFKQTAWAPRIAKTGSVSITVILDNASIEFFADNGLTTMTSIFFPKEPYHLFSYKSLKNPLLENVNYSTLKSIW